MESFSEGPSKAVADRIAQWEARVEDLTTEADNVKRQQAIDVARPSVREIAVKMLNDLHTPRVRRTHTRNPRALALLDCVRCFRWSGAAKTETWWCRMISGNTIVIIAHCLKGVNLPHMAGNLDYGPYKGG